MPLPEELIPHSAENIERLYISDKICAVSLHNKIAQDDINKYIY